MRFRRQRDEAAFAEVVERHGRLVWVVCKQALSHHQDVEDAFQATFFILAQRANTIRSSESAAAWLYRVAQRTAIAARKRRARLREEELTVEPPQGEEALPMIQDRQMLRVLMEELQALPQRYRTPLVMQYFEGQSRRAIAEQTDSTLAQIQGRLVRGKRMLRSRLMRRGVSLSLAAGAVVAANMTASAAVSPSLVAATAASSSSFQTSGATGSASPAAAELSKQGLSAMWYASVTKVATIVVTLLVGLGVAWAAGMSGEKDRGTSQVAVSLQQHSGMLNAANDDNETTLVVDAPVADVNREQVPTPIDDFLLAILDEEDKKSIVTRLYLDLRGLPPTPEQIDRFLNDDRPDALAHLVRELLNSPAYPAKVGGEPPAPLFPNTFVPASPLEMEQESWLLKAKAYRMKAAQMRELIKRQAAPSITEADAMLLEADAAMAEVKAMELAREAAAGKAGASQVGDQQQEQLAKQKEEIEREIRQLRNLIAQISTVSGESEIESERAEQAWLQRELERLHEIYMQTSMPLARLKDEEGKPIQGEALATVKREIQDRIASAKAQLEERRNRIASITQGIEEDNRERAAIERKLEFLEEANLRLEFPQFHPGDSSPDSINRTEATNPKLNAVNADGGVAILRATMEQMEKSLNQAFQERDTLRQENEQLKAQRQRASDSTHQASPFARLIDEEAGRLSITDKEKVQALALPTVQPRTWQWRLYLPQGARYKWRAAAGDIPKDSLPEDGMTTVSNEPYWEDETEVLVTARLVESDYGKGRLVVTSRTTEQSQMAGVTVDVPADVLESLSRSSQDGRNLGDRGTKVLDPEGPIILLQKRAIDASDSEASSDPRPGFVLWLESY